MLRPYPLTAALLIVHEMDSVYWREWDLFGLPGGVEGFLLLHVPLALAVLWGQVQVHEHTRAGFWMSVAVGIAGLATAAIHGAFLLGTGAQFRTVGSISLIAATAASGLVLLISTAIGPRLVQPAE